MTLHSISSVRAVTHVESKTNQNSSCKTLLLLLLLLVLLLLSLPPLCPRSAHLGAADTRLPLHKLSAGDAAVTAALVVT